MKIERMQYYDTPYSSARATKKKLRSENRVGDFSIDREADKQKQKNNSSRPQVEIFEPDDADSDTLTDSASQEENTTEGNNLNIVV